MSEIIPASPFTGNRLDQGLPKTGEYYWIKPDPENEEEKNQEPSLMCVERVYSNHVAFSIDNDRWSSTERVSIFDLLSRITFEPDWKRIIEDRMLKIKGEMEKATKLLYDDIGMHKDRKKRSWHFNKMPKITSVIRVRLGKESDVIPEENRGRHYRVEGRSLEECLGVLGVDIAWEAGEKRYPRHSWSEDQEIYEKLCHAWIPMHEVFNISEYRLGDYKKFAGSRTQKAEYIKWAPAFLSAEDWHAKQAEKDRKILAKAKHLQKS